MVIYKITNKTNGKVYIGQTVRTLEKRWKEHIWDSKHRPKNYLHKSMNKYGKESFKIEIVSKASDIGVLNHRESYCIKLYNTLSPNGYNLMTGGDNSIPCKKLKEKMAIAQGGKPFEVYSKDTGKLIGKWTSMVECSKVLGISSSSNIAIALKHNYKTLGNYVFKHIDSEKKLLFGEELEKTTRIRSSVNIGSKPYKVYLKETGEFVGEWINQTICSEDLSIHATSISNCLHKRCWSVDKYIMKYSDSEEKLFFGKELDDKIRFLISKSQGAKPFNVYCKGTKEFIGEWVNQKICSEDLYISVSGVNACLNNRRKSAKGYLFKYSNL